MIPREDALVESHVFCGPGAIVAAVDVPHRVEAWLEAVHDGAHLEPARAEVGDALQNGQAAGGARGEHRWEAANQRHLHVQPRPAQLAAVDESPVHIHAEAARSAQRLCSIGVVGILGHLQREHAVLVDVVRLRIRRGRRGAPRGKHLALCRCRRLEAGEHAVNVKRVSLCLRDHKSRQAMRPGTCRPRAELNGREASRWVEAG
mmetsp:Transcript_22937/g.52970  ORF Transcript_22937/g.52970 Transcript_22937/m.52970 type:complete len:204 (+) Transcript_22937:7003-7614(+)